MATISFFGGANTPIDNLSGSGLGFFGGSFGSSVELNAFQGSTYITNGAGTTTVNTDIKGYVSRDNGANYTQGTLVSQGTTGGHTILTFHDLDISSQPSGTAMRYKITTHNQSASKTTRIQAVSLGWS